MLIEAEHLRPRILMSPFGNVAFSDWPDGPMVPADAAATIRLLLDASGHPRTDEAVLTGSGREALGLALAAVGLRPEDEVYIHTTTGSPYISRCVTDTIGHHAARTMSLRTKAVVVIHEFGFPARLPEHIIASGLPVINDCAYALGVRAAAALPGLASRCYTIFSFSKAFPIPFGGALVGPDVGQSPTTLSCERAEILSWALGELYLPQLDRCRNRRHEVWTWYEQEFGRMGLRPKLIADVSEAVPHAFMVDLGDDRTLLPLRERMNRQGIESSGFFGNGAYFLPCHQSMGRHTVRYVVDSFLQAMKTIET